MSSFQDWHEKEKIWQNKCSKLKAENKKLVTLLKDSQQVF